MLRDFRFFHGPSSHGSLSIPVAPFRFFENSRKNLQLRVYYRHECYRWSYLPRFKMIVVTPAANLLPVCHLELQIFKEEQRNRNGANGIFRGPEEDDL